MALTQVSPGMLASDSQYTGFKSRIINGGMVIDQRNAGASVALNSDEKYITDRFIARASNSTSSTAIRSTTTATGFKNSLLITIGTGATASGSNYIGQKIEGLNVYDLNWGSASAATVTLSFWVRSSLTGTFGGALQNNAGNRSYPFTYTISSANTFEQKSITIAGDTSGTWLTDTSTGIALIISLGEPAGNLGTAGSWAGADYRGATGQTNLVATSGATLYLTGVQLEKGSTATSFDYRPISTEIQLCQRYFVRWRNSSTSDGTVWNPQVSPIQSGTTGNIALNPSLPTVMRTTATSITTNLTNANYTSYWTLDSAYVTGNVTKTGTVAVQTTGSASSVTVVLTGATWSPNPNIFYLVNTSAYVDISAEL